MSETNDETHDPKEKHPIADRITGLGQKIIGEIETIGGILTADPNTAAEGEFNLEVGDLRDEVEEDLEESKENHLRDARHRAKTNRMSASVERIGMPEFVLPKRLQGLQPTLIRQFFERALPESINFGLGEPDLLTPDFLREEAARVTLEEQNGYTSHPGIPALREKIAEQYRHLNLGLSDIVVTCGSQEAMTAAFLSIVDAGDEVLIPNPSFPAYDACVRIAQGNPVYYRLPADQDFKFDISDFKSRITPKTKAAVVISPSNPTGKIFTEADLRQIAEVLDGTGIYLISDEIYSDLYFGERPHSASEFYDRTVIVSGLSKSLSMTGWRLGWAASQRPEIMKAIHVLHGFLTVCASAITQKASLLGWTAEAEEFKQHAREVYKKRGDFLVDLFDKELGLKATSPQGAFYTMLDVRSLGDDVEIAEKCLQNRVVTVPGVAFGTEAKGFLRISFCNTEEKMIEGVRRMKEALYGD